MNSSRPTLVYHLALSFTALIYGVNYFTMKWIFDIGHLHPLGVLCIRSFFSSLFFVVFYLLFLREKIKSWADFGRMLLCALTGMVINQAMFIWGVSQTTLVNAAVLQTMSPVFVFIATIFIGQEIITKKKVTGLSLSLAGAALLVIANAEGNFSFSSKTLTGDLMIMVNAAVYGIYLVIAKPLFLKYNLFTLQAWQFGLAALVNIPLGAGYVQEIQFADLPIKAWFGLAFFIVFATIVAYILYAWALKHMNPSSVSVYIYFQPVFVSVISVLLNEGTVTFEKIIYILIIFSGVYLVTSRTNSALPPKGTIPVIAP